MITISAQSCFQVTNEKKFAKLMAEYVPKWTNFFKSGDYCRPEEIEESAIRQATAQVAREHPDVLRFSVMTSREIFRDTHSGYFERFEASERFRAMFAEV